jgi:hypothetical protein
MMGMTGGRESGVGDAKVVADRDWLRTGKAATEMARILDGPPEVCVDCMNARTGGDGMERPRGIRRARRADADCLVMVPDILKLDLLNQEAVDGT